jgi:hypothetical protein
VGKTNNFVVGLGKTAWTSVSDPANNVPTSPHLNPFWNLEPMPRWRYSLRTFLLVIVAATALTSLAANHLLRCRRVRQSQEWLESQGVDCEFYRNNKFDKPYFWEFPSRVYVNALFANDKPPSPIYWQHINQVGPLIRLQTFCNDRNSHEFQHCLRTHRNTLQEINLRCKHLSLETGLALSECQQLDELEIMADSVESTFQLQPLPKLKSVSIRWEALRTGDLPWLSKQPSLSSLTLWNDNNIAPEISPELVSTIGRCPNLEELLIFRHSVNVDEVGKLILIPTLKRLQLPATFLSSESVDKILASSLVEVEIQDCRIATKDLQRLMACERIQEITIRLGMLDCHWLPVNRATPLRVWVVRDDQLSTDRICQIVTRCLRPDSGTVIFNIGYGVPGYELFECEAVKEIGPGMMDDPPWLNFP